MTDQQKFAYLSKAGKLPKDKRQPSTHGYLEYLGVKLTNPMPYALLQHKKKEFIAAGHSPKHLKIKRAD